MGKSTYSVYPRNASIVEIDQTVCPCGATLYQKLIIFAILGLRYPTPGVDWREILQDQVDPRAPWLCQISRESGKESPLWCKNTDFRPTSKFKYWLTTLCVILLVNKMYYVYIASS